MSKELLKAAKIGVGEFAKLAGVSRVTASLWANDHAKPHPLHEVKINALWDSIANAVKDGKLPLTAKSTKEIRMTELANIVGGGA